MENCIWSYLQLVFEFIAYLFHKYWQCELWVNLSYKIVAVRHVRLCS
jgi:hypothetical protein